MDQVIVSTIGNEKNRMCSISDMIACWTEICNNFFIDEFVSEQLKIFDDNFLCTVPHGLASVSTEFFHKMYPRDLYLMDAGVYGSTNQSFMMIIFSTILCI